jgi:hypothetical protein
VTSAKVGCWLTLARPILHKYPRFLWPNMPSEPFLHHSSLFATLLNKFIPCFFNALLFSQNAWKHCLSPWPREIASTIVSELAVNLLCTHKLLAKRFPHVYYKLTPPSFLHDKHLKEQTYSQATKPKL